MNGTILPAAQDPPVGGDPRHDHTGWLERTKKAVKLQYKEADIAPYFSYSRQFTLCDNYFTEITSQSEPNHLMLIAADSPIIDNASKPRTYQPQEPFAIPSLPENLQKAGLSWATYGDPGFSYFESITALKGSKNIFLGRSWTRTRRRELCRMFAGCMRRVRRKSYRNIRHTERMRGSRR